MMCIISEPNIASFSPSVSFQDFILESVEVSLIIDTGSFGIFQFSLGFINGILNSSHNISNSDTVSNVATLIENNFVRYGRFLRISRSAPPIDEKLPLTTRS